MNKSAEQERLRLEIAAVLDDMASHSGWSEELWSKFNALLEQADVDGILAHAYEEVVHYSGEFNSRNLLMIRVKLTKSKSVATRASFDKLPMQSGPERGGMNTNGRIAFLKQAI